MVDHKSPLTMDLLVFIANKNESKHVLKYAAEKNFKRSTILPGEGTANNTLLKKLGLATIRKEIVFLVGPSQHCDETFHHIAQKMEFTKKNKGIGFKVPLKRLIGMMSNRQIEPNIELRKEENQVEYQAIVVIVDQGTAEDVMDIAEANGARGGTVLRGRSGASNEKEKLFNMEIEPEKDVLLILSHADTTKSISTAIADELEFEDANTGILFVTDVSETIGLY